MSKSILEQLDKAERTDSVLRKLIDIAKAAKESVEESKLLFGLDPWFRETAFERLVKALAKLEGGGE